MFAFISLYKLKGTPHYYMNQSISERNITGMNEKKNSEEKGSHKTQN
jgi:hypothetical protein